jgi:hypothetical protein
MLSCAFTLLVVHHSEAYGKLRVVPTYDDVCYFNDGWARLNDLYSGGLPTAISRYLANPPHSPFSSYLAALSYALLGFHQSAPYYLNGVIVLVLLLVADYYVAPGPWWHYLLVYFFALALPYTAWAVREFRPDIACGLVTAMGLMWMLRADWLDAGRSHRCVAGAFLALALLIKPTVFAFTLIVFAGTLGWVCLRDWRTKTPRPNYQLVLRSSLPLVLTATALAGPYFLVAGRRLWQYFFANILGTERYLWEYRAGLKEHLAYYLSGQGGRAMFGPHLGVVVGLAALGIALMVWKKRVAGAGLNGGMLVVGFVVWLLPTMNSVKTPYFGATFGFFLFLGALQVLVHLLRGIPIPGLPLASTRIVAVLAVLLALAVWRIPGSHHALSSARADDINEVCHSVYRAVKECRSGPASTVFVTATGYINSDVLAYFAAQDNIDDLRFIGVTNQLQEVPKQFDKATIVVASEVGNGLANEEFPCGQFQEQSLQMVRDHDDFVQAAAIATASGKHYYVFRRKIP